MDRDQIALEFASAILRKIGNLEKPDMLHCFDMADQFIAASKVEVRNKQVHPVMREIVSGFERIHDHSS